MPNDSKLYLCFEYCDYDLKKYMKSCQYKLSANCIKARAACPLFQPDAGAPASVSLLAADGLSPLLSPWQSFTYQMLNGLNWCHSHRIFHRCAPRLAACSRPSAAAPCCAVLRAPRHALW